MADTIAEGMDADIPSVTDIEAETARNMERPYVGQGVDDTLDDNFHEVIPEEAGPKKKSKKRKHKKSVDAGESSVPKKKLSKESVDAGESSVPKKKLSKEEKAVKKARKAERRARRAAQEAADAKAIEDDVPEEVRPSVPQQDVSVEWLPKNEPKVIILMRRLKTLKKRMLLL
ncbi:hypothetical protein LIER_08017 [Lithospermum erythrorhizon]|uniref:Uncharacterized protein n=1 Tax=Lithospermum erythrorhizon TaxID=34254 RepID=A0AAV3PBM5_LITER